MSAIYIGGIVACCEPGCEEVFGSVKDWQVHMYLDHQGPDPDDWSGSDACYAEGIRRTS